MKITRVSNYKNSNRTLVIGHPRDRAPTTWQIGTRRTNHDNEFCYRYYKINDDEEDDDDDDDDFNNCYDYKYCYY